MKTIIGIILATAAVVATAACITHTYMVDGQLRTCTTCCTGNNCFTNCV